MTDKELDELDEDASEFVNIIRNPEEEEGDDYKEVVMALIVAVYFLVLARRRSPPLDKSANGKQPAVSDNPSMSPATESRKMDKKTFTEMRQTALSSLGLPAAEKRHGEDVDAWIEMIQTLKWAKGQEWFDNIPLAGEREDELGNGLYDDDDDVDKDGHDGSKAQGGKRRKTNIFLHAGKDEEGLLLPGLGTMMQDRIDYLSEDRKEDYLEWKADMLERIGKIMKTGKRMVV
jgi:origin recognition complex subunit 6